MGSAVERDSPPDFNAARSFPAFGPIEATLGYGLFYVLVDRVTPAVIEVFSETVLDLPASLVGFGLAAGLWFVLAVTVFDQLRRQLAALGVLSVETDQLRLWSRLTPGPVRTGGYLLGLVGGSLVAWVTFDRAVNALLSLIPAVATIDVASIDLGGLVLMILFFLSYSLAARSLDRLLIEAIRWSKEQ